MRCYTVHDVGKRLMKIYACMVLSSKSMHSINTSSPGHGVHPFLPVTSEWSLTKMIPKTQTLPQYDTTVRSLASQYGPTIYHLIKEHLNLKFSVPAGHTKCLDKIALYVIELTFSSSGVIV